jgi:hypothetical protein
MSADSPDSGSPILYIRKDDSISWFDPEAEAKQDFGWGRGDRLKSGRTLGNGLLWVPDGETGKPV